MCDLSQDFTTVTGPRSAVQWLTELWGQLDTPRRLDVDRPELIELGGLGAEFNAHDCPQVGVIEHEQGLGMRVAGALQAEVLSRYPQRARVLFEPGFLVSAAAAGHAGGPGHPSVILDQTNVAAATNVTNLPSVTNKVSGSKVALLDSGDSNAINDMVIFNGSTPLVTTADDAVGHGTAMAELIRLVAPKADIHPVRVVHAPQQQAPSYDVLNALIYCLWADQSFDIINASLTTQVLGACPTALGASLAYIIGLTPHRRPVLVAASGNNPPTKNLGYPALLPDVLVAQALDWSGNLATYNPPTQSGVKTCSAYGGTAARTLGKIQWQGQPDVPIFGTSAAAAIITGAHLP
jgi:hypothetical protein